MLTYGIGAPAGFSPTAPVTTDDYVTAVKLHYDVRGELTGLDAISPATSSNGYTTLVKTTFQYGFPSTCVSSSVSTQCGAPDPLGDADPYTGAGLGESLPQASPTGPCTWTSATVQYDASGRYQQSTSRTTCTSNQAFRTRVYDAENHVTTDTCNDVTNGIIPNICRSVGSFAYTWGPTGNLRGYAGSVFHWDGNHLLYVSDGNGHVRQLNVEKLGVGLYGSSNNESGFIVYDRDFSGTAVDWHTSTGAKGITATGNFYVQHKYFAVPTLVGDYGCSDPADGDCEQAQAAPFDAVRADGYQVGNLVIQGVRAFDPGLGQWITPDGYKGTVADPMTQRPYQWNAGNPLTNSDSTGFSTYDDTANTVDCPAGNQNPACGYDPNSSPPGCESGSDCTNSNPACSGCSLPQFPPVSSHPSPSSVNNTLQNKFGPGNPWLVLGSALGVLAWEGEAPSTVAYRYMSRAEFDDMVKSGLLRGGRGGTHYATDARFGSASEANDALQLPVLPELGVKLKIAGTPFAQGPVPGGSGYQFEFGGKISVEVLESWVLGR